MNTQQPRNLQKELENIIRSSEASGIRPKLLLHVCCAPCSSYCLEYLNRYFEITVYFANSNIDDAEEYRKRREEARRLLRELPMEVPAAFAEGPYDPEEYHRLVAGHEADPEGGARCGICFRMRLEQAAEAAKRMGMDYFTTSLTISPLKNAQRLCSIGEAAGEKYGIPYLPSDFKKKGGYQRSIELSREYGLYRQDYCGCSFSAKEREERVRRQAQERMKPEA